MHSVTVFYAASNNRSQIIAKAMHAGIKRCGRPVELKASVAYRGRPHSDIAIFYGLAEGLRNIFRDYRESGRRALYIDLGYWGRRKRSRWDGYHKVVLNSRHPTAYFQDRPHSSDRFEAFGIPILPWRTEGRHIIVAGMSAKAAAAENLRAEQWERDTIRRLRDLTRRPIIYRPKPNWPGARPIFGSTFQQGVELADALKDCHAVVTHHSNVAIDALLAGVPVVSPEGAASVLAERDLSKIENPRMPDGRAQWAADLAYTQFSVEEMENGRAWSILMKEGLVR